ncbi:MAG: aminopeptidase [Candidatus Pacearchaeota archaeon]
MPTDLRARELAKLAVKLCTKVKKGENVIISGSSESEPFIIELYKQVILAGAHPIIRMIPNNISDFFYKYANEEQLKNFPKYWFDTVKSAQVYIGIYTDLNTRELTSVNSERISIRKKILNPISDYIVNNRDKIRRLTIAYPCLAHAIEAEMSLTEWENFVYSSCLQNWPVLIRKMKKIRKLFKEGSFVHLIGPNLDLKFRVHGEKAVCDTNTFENMPAGEIFMAPFKESLNGWVKFDYPAIEAGKEVSGIYLEFKEGKVVNARAEKNQNHLYSLLNIDENAKYVGEFGIGCNPKINKFTKNLLFDEKIEGTIHLALGMSYKENGSYNNSALHWDLVKDMKNGKIIVDNKVIQSKGIWRI